MATARPEVHDLLDKECLHLYKCKESVESLYFACGATEVAIEHLLRPYGSGGLDFQSVIEQMRSMKTILDNNMKVVRLLFRNVSECQKELTGLKDVDQPDLADQVQQMRHILMDFSQELRSVLIRGANLCVAFHVACKAVLDFLIELYCEPLKEQILD